MTVLRPYFGVASLALLLAVVVACSGQSEAGPDEYNSSSFGISIPAQKAGGSQAPSFTVSTGEGSTFSLDEHRNEVVILYFSFPG